MSMLATVIIPVRNEAANIRRCLDSVLSQKLDGQFEVLVIDSGSTDGTVEIARNYGVRLHLVSHSEFGHGKTRQLGATLARGTFTVFTVADAEPEGTAWLSKLIQPMLQDESVAASYGMQAVRPTGRHNPVAAAMLLRQSGRQRTQSLNGDVSFAQLSPLERRMLCNFDDCTSCMRKAVLHRITIPSVSYAEDFLWCKKAILAGYKIAFVPEAVVYHYHKQSCSYAFNRYCYDQTVSEKEFGLFWRETPLQAARELFRSARDYAGILRKENINPFRKMTWFLYNLKVELARNAGYLAGSLPSSEYGRRHRLLSAPARRMREKVRQQMEGRPIIHE